MPDLRVCYLVNKATTSLTCYWISNTTYLFYRMTLQPSLLPRDDQSIPWGTGLPQGPSPYGFPGVILPPILSYDLSGNMFLSPHPFSQIPCCQFHQHMLFAQCRQTMYHWTDVNARAQQFSDMTAPYYQAHSDTESSASPSRAQVDLDLPSSAYAGYPLTDDDDGYFVRPRPPSPMDDWYIVSNSNHPYGMPK